MCVCVLWECAQRVCECRASVNALMWVSDALQSKMSQYNHGLIGLWPFRFFSFQEFHQCLFLSHWKIPIATENWQRWLLLKIHFWGRQVSLSLSIVCVCSVNIHDAHINLHFATYEYYVPLKSHDDPLYFSSEGHADPLYHPAVGSPGVKKREWERDEQL